MVYVKSITVGPKNIKIKRGTWYYDVYADVCPTNATNKSLDWHSSNPSVASVNCNGDICGVSEGTAVIYATATDGSGVADFCNVTVQEHVKVHAVAVTPKEKTVGVGTRFSLSAQAYPETADNRAVRWSSCDTNIATVDYYSGCVTAKAVGSTKIYATAVDGSGIEGYCTVTVKTIPVSSIVINPASKIMGIGSSTTLVPFVLPIDATNKSIRWSSSDENVATVNPITGYVEAKNLGTTNIRASSQDGSNQYMNCPITVKMLSENSNYSWEELGFVYDGSMQDFRRVEAGLPPIAYERWLASGYGYSNDAYWDAILGNHGAIYVVDYDEHEGLPIVGHAYVLLKGSDGKWIRTEFMGDFEGFGENIIETLVNFIDAKKDATVSYDDEIQVSQIISDLSIEAVSQHWTLSDGSTLTGFCAGVQYVPLKGDFSPGIEKADGYCGSDYGGYSLFSNNCLHYAKEILCEGTARNQPTENFLHESENFIPMVFASELRSIEV